MKKTRMKGGSLAGTYLMEDGDRTFIRKEASLVENREYGFQRWYSQLKRLQRYGIMFPGVFPRLLDFGMNGDMGYFDLEYIEESTTVQEFLVQTTDDAKISALFDALLSVAGRMHATRIESTSRPLELYVQEEVVRKIQAVQDNPRFKAFTSEGTIVFNGIKIPGLLSVLDEYVAMFQASYVHTSETFTHGNLTLENILYQPATNRIVFIDPYEENIIDSVLAEWSQVYQSSNSYYEVYNAGVPRVAGNSASMDVPRYAGLDRFNALFTDYIKQRHSDADYIAIKLFEVSQFMRMLPFKKEIDQEMMLFFYALGSELFNSIRA